MAIYWLNGVLGSFAKAVLPHTAFRWLAQPTPQGAQLFQWPERIPLGLVWQDYSIWALAPFFVLFSGFAVVLRLRDQMLLAVWTAAAGVLTCAIFFLLAVTAPYYSWMIFVPLAAAIFSLASGVRQSARKGWMAGTITALAVAACLFSSASLVRRAAKVAVYGSLMPQAQLAEQVRSLMGNAKIIYCEDRAYYAVKKTGRTVFTGLYRLRMSDKEKANCDAVIVDSDNVPDWVARRAEAGTLREAGKICDPIASGGSPWLVCIAGNPGTNMRRVNFVVFVQPGA
jgi:hypothetical protein